MNDATAPVGNAATGDPPHGAPEPQVRDASHWRQNYLQRPYVGAGDTFDDFGPAFDFGASSGQRHAGRAFDDVEPELAIEWPSARGGSSLAWDRARHAARDAWDGLPP